MIVTAWHIGFARDGQPPRDQQVRQSAIHYGRWNVRVDARSAFEITGASNGATAASTSR
jgi:hypothetical protein